VVIQALLQQTTVSGLKGLERMFETLMDAKHAEALHAGTSPADDFHVWLHRHNTDQTVADYRMIVNAKDSNWWGFCHLWGNSMAYGSVATNLI
jgi:hypothetical protein